MYAATPSSLYKSFSVRKLANARVQNFYAYGNFCDYSSVWKLYAYTCNTVVAEQNHSLAYKSWRTQRMKDSAIRVWSRLTATRFLLFLLCCCFSLWSTASRWNGTALAWTRKGSHILQKGSLWTKASCALTWKTTKSRTKELEHLHQLWDKTPLCKN